MASIYDLKPKFQTMLRPLCAWLVALGVRANHVTLGAGAMCLIYGGALFWTRGAPVLLLLLGVVLFIRMGLNAIDGMLAREYDQKTDFGAILNELTDVLSDIALYLPLGLIAGVDPTLVVLVVSLGVITEFAGVNAQVIGATRRYDGPFGKSDRAFFFGALAFAIGIGLTPGPWVTALLAVGVVLAGVTTTNRVRGALKEKRDGLR